MVSSPEPVVMMLAEDEPGDRDRGRKRRRVDVLEIEDFDAVAGGLVDICRRARLIRMCSARSQQTSVSLPVPPSIETSGAVILDGVVAGAGIDNVVAAAAIDRIRSGAADNGIAPTRCR